MIVLLHSLSTAITLPGNVLFGAYILPNINLTRVQNFILVEISQPTLVQNEQYTEVRKMHPLKYFLVSSNRYSEGILSIFCLYAVILYSQKK